MPITSKDLAKRLSKRLANFKVSDAVVSALAERVFIDGLDIRKFDVCIYGICIDYFTTKLPSIEKIFRATDVSRFEVFPYGIIDWDYFHVHVGYNVDELAGHNAIH